MRPWRPIVLALLACAVSSCSSVPLSWLTGRKGPEAAKAPPPPPTPAPADAKEEPSPPPAPASPRPSTSTTRAFAIEVQAAGEGTKGIELWTTEDGGMTWKAGETYSPPPRSVPFTASHDGRFGFVLVPISAEGKREATPVPGTEPEMSVLVDTEPPVVVLVTPNGGNVFPNRGQAWIKWTAKDDNLGENPITIEVSRDGGASWSLVCKDRANDGQYLWDLPVESSRQYLVRVTARDLAGNASSATSEAPFLVDGFPPEGRVLGPEVSSRGEVDLQYTAGDPGGAGLAKVSLWVTTDGGETWRHAADDSDTLSPFEVSLPDGSYGLALVCTDRVGNANDPPQKGTRPATTLLVDTTPPAVAFRGFPASPVFPGDEDVDLAWSITEDNPRPDGVTLELSADGGSTWTTVAPALAPDKPYRWRTPSTLGRRYRLRISAEDRAGNLGCATSADFAIDGSVPEAVFQGPAVSASHSVDVAYRVKNMGFLPLARVELWVMKGSGTHWDKVAEDTRCERPLNFEGADGAYGVKVICATKRGLETGKRQPAPDASTQPDGTLVIDTTPPVVRVTAPASPSLFRGGQTVDIVWAAADDRLAKLPVRIDVSSSGGNAWKELAKGLPAEGTWRWTTPRETGDAWLIRVSAEDDVGNVGSAVTEKFGIDSDPPTTRVTGPVVLNQATGAEATVAVEATDAGPAGIAEVVLYRESLGAMRRWEVEQRFDKPPYEAKVGPLADGRWGFVAVASDRAGNRMPEPGPHTEPDLTIVVGTKGPTITLLEPRGGEVVGPGAKVDVRWDAKADGPVSFTVQASDDGGKTWKDLLADEAGATCLRWTLPRDGGSAWRVRVIGRDATGNETTAATASDVLVDSQPPVAVVKGPARANAGSVELEYEAEDVGPAGLGAVQLWLRAEGEKEWRPGPSAGGMATTPGGRRAPLRLVAADGTYDLYLTATDRVGNASAAPTARQEPQCRITIDSTPPVVRLIAPEGGACLRGGASFEVRWSATDEHLGEKCIAIDWSTDDGATWQPVATALANSGRFAWGVPEVDGDRYRVRVRATDEFGNRAEAASEKGFLIDSRPPVATIVGPAAWTSRDGEVVVQAHDEGLSGVAKVELWTSSDNGATWHGPIPTSWHDNRAACTLPEGRIGLFAVATDRAGNASPAPAPGTPPQATLLVDTRRPALSVRGLAEGDLLRPGRPIAIAWEATGDFLPVSPVHVEVVRGTDAPLVLRDAAPAVDRATWTPSADGAYVLRVTAVNAVGTAARFEVRFEVDGSGPRIAWVQGIAQEGLQGGREVELAWRAEAAHFGDKPVTLEFSSDRGATWQTARAELPATGRTIWRAPEIDCLGSCLLRLVAKDRLGNAADAPLAKPFSITTNAPPIQVTLPAATREGKFIAPVHWVLDRAGFSSVEVWHTDDGGRRWECLSTTRAADLESLSLALAEGRHGISLVCVRADGTKTAPPRAGTPPQYTVLVDGTPPKVTLLGAHDGDIVEAGQTITVTWEAHDEEFGSGPVTVRAGSDKTPAWREFKDLPATGSVQVPTDPSATEMRIEVRAQDACGNQSTSSVRLVLDPDAPEVTLSSPAGRVVRGGAPVPVSWKAKDRDIGDRPVELRVSTNGGRTWRTVARGLPAIGQAAWTAPTTSEADVRLAVRVRDLAGKEAIATLPAPFAVDASAPVPHIAPAGVVSAEDVQVCCDAQDDLSGVASIELWVRAAGTARWECAGRVATGTAKFPLTRPDGTWELLAVATDGAGNRSAAPDDATPPMTTRVFDREGPTVDVFGLEKGVRARAGGALDVEWDARCASGVRNVWIEIDERAGGGRTPIRNSLPAAGALSVPLPARDGDLRVWVRAKDAAGHVASAEIPVQLASEGPLVRISGVEGGAVLRAGSVVHLQWRADGTGPDPRPVAVSLGSPDGQWERVKEGLPAEGELDLPLPNATRDVLRIRVSASDEKGRTGESLTTVSLDADPPRSAIVAPAVTRDRAVRAALRVEDIGRAGVRRVAVFGRPRGASTWSVLKELPGDACEAVSLSLDDGVTELYACASDRVGNEAPAPDARSAPMCSVEVVTRPPRVLLPDQPAFVQVAPSSTLPVTWRVETSHPADGPVSITLVTPLGEEKPVDGALPASGTTTLALPALAGEYVARVEARDVAGNLGSTTLTIEVTDRPVGLHVATPLARGFFFRGGTAVPLSWNVEDGKGSVSVLLAEGPSAGWTAVGRDLGPRGELSIPLPPRDVDELLVRVELSEGEKSTLLAKYSVTVLGQPPRARMLAPATSVASRVRIPIEWEDDTIAARAAVFARPAGERTWKEVGSSTGPGAVEVALPDGRWEMLLVAEDVVGNRTPEPRPDASAAASVEVDTRPPTLLLPDANDPLPVAPGANVSLSWEAQDDHPAQDGVDIAWGLAGGTLEPLARGLPAKGTWQGKAPDAEGLYRVRITARDAFGNETAAERVLRVASRPGRPTAEVSAKEGEVIPQGASVEFRWDAGSDEFQEKGVAVLLSADNGVEFKPLAEGLDRVGSFSWTPQQDLPKAIVKVVALERGGRWRELLAPTTLRVLADRPRVSLVVEPVVRERVAVVRAKLETPRKAIASVRLWTTADGGKTWTDAGRAEASPWDVQVAFPADGRYGLYASVTDEKGREWDPAPQPGTAPQSAVIVDTAAPRVTLRNFQGGDTFAGGSTLFVFWDAEHDLIKPDGVGLFLSPDGGRTWSPIARGLRASGKYPWTLPRVSGGLFRLKVTAEDQAGLVGEAQSAKDFAIDSTLPRVEVDLPEAIPSESVDCAWHPVGATISPIKQVTAWVTSDGGKTWKELASAAASHPLKLSLPGAGAFGLTFVAENEVGNKGTPPAPGTPPERSVVVELGPPRVSLVAPAAKGSIRAGEFEVRWEAEGLQLAERSVTLLLSADGGKTWAAATPEPIANIGRSHLRTLPDARTVSVKVVVRDAAGHEGSAEGGPWPVRTGAPKAHVTGVSPDGAVSYAAFDGGVDLVAEELWTSRDDGRSWEKSARVAGSHGELSLPAKEIAKLGLWVVVEDAEGERSDAPTPGATPMWAFVAPPTLRLVSPRGGETFAGGKPHEAAWQASGGDLGDRPVHLYLSADDGKTWAEVGDTDGLPNSGSAWVQMPAASGRGFRLRVLVLDAIGNRAAAETAQAFSLDAEPPHCRLTGPRESASGEVKLEGSFEDAGPAGLARIDLYEWTEGKWVLAAGVEAGKPLVYRGVDGEHRLAAVGIDAVGNAQPPPTVEQDAQISVRIFTRPPEVRLDAVAPKVRGGAPLEVRWTSRVERPAKDGVRIEWSRDGGATWQVVQEALPDTHAYAWAVPAVDEARCRLRVSVADADGHVGTAETPADFRIQTKGPVIHVHFAPQGEGVRPLGLARGGPTAKQRLRAAPRETAPPVREKEEPPQPPAPPSHEADLARARELAGEGRNQEAAEVFRRVLSSDPQCAEAHYRLAVCLTMLKGTEEALKEFQKAVDIAPARTDVRNAYGVVLLLKKDLEGAERQFRAALAAGEDAMSHHNLGIVLYEKKEWGEARKEFEEALALDPKAQDTLYYLGYLDIAIAEWAKARQRLTDCIAIDPHSDTAENARKVIETLPK